MEVRPLLLGHRGTRRHQSIAENTLEAFDFALAEGCDGFEIDVRLSADGQAVICHNAVTPTTSLEISHGAAEELGLPSLREVLSRYRGKAFLDIELKVPGIEKITAELLREFKIDRRGIAVSSFLPDVLESLSCIDRTLPLGLICESQTQLGGWRELAVDYVIPHYKLVTKELISEINFAGKKIIVWTVNPPAAMKRFAKLGVDGIVSDNPEQLFRILRAGIDSKK